MTPAETFAEHIRAILARFLQQNGNAAAASHELDLFAHGLWTLIETRGLPPALAKSEQGTPGEMSEAEVAPLLEAALRGVSDTARTVLAGPAKQLVKACFYPPFRKCRDSFREVSADGTCRRQELARARQRVSGSHCVDCPHWIALSPGQHERYLAREWKTGAAAFESHGGIFLPEDFRALRLLLERRQAHDPAGNVL